MYLFKSEFSLDMCPGMGFNFCYSLLSIFDAKKLEGRAMEEEGGGDLGNGSGMKNVKQ